MGKMSFCLSCLGNTCTADDKLGGHNVQQPWNWWLKTLHKDLTETLPVSRFTQGIVQSWAKSPNWESSIKLFSEQVVSNLHKVKEREIMS